jgi:hypothetical protein
MTEYLQLPRCMYIVTTVRVERSPHEDCSCSACTKVFFFDRLCAVDGLPHQYYPCDLCTDIRVRTRRREEQKQAAVTAQLAAHADEDDQYEHGRQEDANMWAIDHTRYDTDVRVGRRKRSTRYVRKYTRDRTHGCGVHSTEATVMGSGDQPDVYRYRPRTHTTHKGRCYRDRSRR